jgi:hypothetical protein
MHPVLFILFFAKDGPNLFDVGTTYANRVAKNKILKACEENTLHTLRLKPAAFRNRKIFSALVRFFTCETNLHYQYRALLSQQNAGLVEEAPEEAPEEEEEEEEEERDRYAILHKSYHKIVCSVLRVDGMLLERVPDRLKSCKTYVLIAVRNNGLALQFASNDLKEEYDIVCHAVKQNGLALQYVSHHDGLSDQQKAFVEHAVNQNGLALQYVSQEMRNDDTIVLIALLNNACSIRYASNDLKEKYGLLAHYMKRDI